MTSLVDIADYHARLTLIGNLTCDDGESFQDSLQKLGAKPLQEVTLNMTRLEFIDSAGLGMLLLLRDHLPRSCRIVLSNANARIQKILSLTRLDYLFTLL